MWRIICVWLLHMRKSMFDQTKWNNEYTSCYRTAYSYVYTTYSYIQ